MGKYITESDCLIGLFVLQEVDIDNRLYRGQRRLVKMAAGGHTKVTLLGKIESLDLWCFIYRRLPKNGIIG